MRNILVLCILLVLLIGCTPTNPPLSVLRSSKVVVLERENVSYDFSLVVTVGNRSYLPVNKGGDPADMAMNILNIMDQFEKNHPEWEITNWHIEKQQNSYLLSPYVFGLWVDHKSRAIK